MRSKPTGLLLAAAVALAFVPLDAQEKTAVGQPKLGPYSVPKHWSKYQYPEAVPEGMAYHIIEKGDTLWDLAQRYLRNPLLWPQIWDQNKYIKDAHWIYPLDPIALRPVEVVADKAGQTPDVPTDVAVPGSAPSQAGHEGPAANPLYPASELVTLQCAPQIVEGKDDDSVKVVGSEQGRLQVSYSDRDILYLSKGSNAGIKPGDVVGLHSAVYKVKHPKTGKTLGTKVLTKGWARVIAVQETSATVVVEQACTEILQDDYAKPFQKASVPMLVRQDPPNRLTPPSGRAQGYVIDIGHDNLIGGTGNLLWVDVGSESGVAPGNLMTVYRVEYPKLPSSRHVLGELAVLAVKDKLALARVNYSTTMIETGDSVELR